MFLSPEDSLVLECLGDYLFPLVKEAQPSQSAYFSRRQPTPGRVEDFEGNFGYPWWILWPRFQSQILGFTQEHKFVVTADVATYFDGIEFSQLRNYLAGLIEESEPFLDFVFFVLERFVWRPDYLPFPGRGLPQANLDFPRLLAHAFLFDVDRYLKDETNDDFVRWMDDIDFGCDSEIAARRLLQGMDELLQSRGLHLNASKCQILDRDAAREHFQVQENRFLTVLKNRLERKISAGQSHYRAEKALLRRRYREFRKRPQRGMAGKVLKRYINFAAQLEDSRFDRDVKRFLFQRPDLRDTVLRYMECVGWSHDREAVLTRFIVDSVDELSVFRAVQVLLRWNPIGRIPYIYRMRRLATRIEESGDVGFLCALWLVGKFGNSAQIGTFINRRTLTWTRHPWLARQVASLAPRCSSGSQIAIENAVNSFGLRDAKAVLDNYRALGKGAYGYTQAVRSYILATRKDGSYIFPKLLIALNVLQGALPDPKKAKIREELMAVVRDPIYRRLILRSGVTEGGMTDV